MMPMESESVTKITDDLIGRDDKPCSCSARIAELIQLPAGDKITAKDLVRIPVVFRKFFSRFINLSWLVTLFCLFLLPAAQVWAGAYSSSAHGNSSTGVDRSTIDSKYSAFATGSCAHCHEQHASLEGSEPAPTSPSGPNAAMVFSPEEKLCFTCHDGSAAGGSSRDILTQFNETYRHPIDLYSGRHTLSKLEYGKNGAPFRGSLRHVECTDCHNPHVAQPGTQTFDTSNPQNNNLVSNVLKGVWGVDPTFGAAWTVPTSFTEKIPAVKEYQICLKCHSNYAFNTGSGSYSVSDSPSGLSSVTDQAMEFNPANASYHPVVTTANLGNANSLLASRLGPPWNSAPGDQTMYCSDCHGDTDSSKPDGPHGSTNKYLLKWGSWPTQSDGTTLWTLNDLSNSGIFCKLCHTLSGSNTGGGNWGHFFWSYNTDSSGGNNVHTQSWHRNYSCVTCHSAVPHGSKHERLIVYASDPAPYNYNGNTAKITKFTFESGSYSTSDCQATCSGIH
ncbi:MAG TPA: hypothetical protein ENK33_07580 [Desulfobacterales bacterium]|nr:hypothetical protein [Desulfobacterales bacterium]